MHQRSHLASPAPHKAKPSAWFFLLLQPVQMWGPILTHGTTPYLVTMNSVSGLGKPIKSDLVVSSRGAENPSKQQGSCGKIARAGHQQQAAATRSSKRREVSNVLDMPA